MSNSSKDILIEAMREYGEAAKAWRRWLFEVPSPDTVEKRLAAAMDKLQRLQLEAEVDDE
jgi:hypothetical protein